LQDSSEPALIERWVPTSGVQIPLLEQDPTLARANASSVAVAMNHLNTYVPGLGLAMLRRTTDSSASIGTSIASYGSVDPNRILRSAIQRCGAANGTVAKGRLVSTEQTVSFESLQEEAARTQIPAERLLHGLIQDGFVLEEVIETSSGQTIIGQLVAAIQATLCCRAEVTLSVQLSSGVGRLGQVHGLDQMVVQVCGKRTVGVAPTSEPSWLAGVRSPARDVTSFSQMRAGSALFVPRGTYYTAMPHDGVCVWVTVRLRRLTLLDLLPKLQRKWALKVPELRTDLPADPTSPVCSQMGSPLLDPKYSAWFSPTRQRQLWSIWRARLRPAIVSKDAPKQRGEVFVRLRCPGGLLRSNSGRIVVSGMQLGVMWPAENDLLASMASGEWRDLEELKHFQPLAALDGHGLVERRANKVVEPLTLW